MVLSKTQKIFLAISLILVSLAIFLFAYLRKDSDLKANVVKINNQLISVEVASSQEQQYNGLSNRESLCKDCGMLFAFPDKQVRKFVMRNMKFPLDIVFISDNKIINIEKNLKPEGANPTNIYQSVSPADMVLELNGAYTDENNINIGDKLVIENR